MKPILFNQEMVKAILDGRKSCTRRIAKYIKSYEIDENGYVFARIHNHAKFISFGGGTMQMFLEKFAPYQVGDILYVREMQSIHRVNNISNKFVRVHYKVDDSVIDYKVTDEEWKRLAKYDYTDEKFISPYWTTKETCRIFLNVTDVRVERLQDITEEQAKKEGCIDYQDKIGNGELWNSTVDKNKIQQYGWNANPYIWVIEFERCEKPESTHED